MKPNGLFEFQTPWGNAGIAQSWHLYKGDSFDPECPDSWRLKWDLFHQDADGRWVEMGSLNAETFVDALKEAVEGFKSSEDFHGTPDLPFKPQKIGGLVYTSPDKPGVACQEPVV